MSAVSVKFYKTVSIQVCKILRLLCLKMTDMLENWDKMKEILNLL